MSNNVKKLADFIEEHAFSDEVLEYFFAILALWKSGKVKELEE